MPLSINITKHAATIYHTVLSHTFFTEKKAYNMYQPKIECSFPNLGEDVPEHFYKCIFWESFRQRLGQTHFAFGKDSNETCRHLCLLQFHSEPVPISMSILLPYNGLCNHLGELQWIPEVKWSITVFKSDLQALFGLVLVGL